jgi:8-oxo-dGTP diphosphatase
MQIQSSSRSIIIGVSCAIFSSSSVLLIQRRNNPFKGKFSLPGGKLEFGESIFSCAKREVEEETGIKVDILATNYVLESISEHAHYVVINMLGEMTDPEQTLKAGDDALTAKWVQLEQFPQPHECTENLLEIVQKARNLRNSLQY